MHQRKPVAPRTGVEIEAILRINQRDEDNEAVEDFDDDLDDDFDESDDMFDDLDEDEDEDEEDEDEDLYDFGLF